MPIVIDQLSVAELLALNERIVARLRFLDQVRAHQDMMAFNIGSRVSFDAPKHGRQVGILLKFNRNTVTVLTDHGRRWNVSPYLLSPVRDVTSHPASAQDRDKRLK